MKKGQNRILSDCPFKHEKTLCHIIGCLTYIIWVKEKHWPSVDSADFINNNY
jgi:hypothetical protein